MNSKKKKGNIEEKGGILIRITIITFLSSLTYEFTTSIQHLCAQGPSDCGSAVRFGRALPGYPIPVHHLYAFSAVIDKFTTSIQHLCAQGPGDCGSAVRFGRALPVHPIPVHHLYTFSAVIGVLAMWWYNKPQTKNQYAKVCCHNKSGTGLSPSDFLRKKIR